MAEKTKGTNSVIIKSSPNEEQGFCFTIMPFSGWFNSYYDTIYKPAIVDAKLKPCRADDLFRPSNIVNDIWSYTQNAKLVLADLTGKNPNVFYELGLAHALAKPVILVTESIDDVPFDLRALRVLEYDKNLPRWGEILQEKITKSINEVLTSPLSAVLPTFLSVRTDLKPKAVSEQDKIILEMRNDLDVLRSEVLRIRRSDIPSISEREAVRILDQFVVDGVPRSVIIRRLSELGVPTSWIIDKLKVRKDKVETLFDESIA